MVKLSELGGDLSGSTADSIIFFVQPTVEHMKLVSKQILGCRAERRPGERFNIYFAPHKTLVCEQVLEDEGVLDCVELREYQVAARSTGQRFV